MTRSLWLLIPLIGFSLGSLGIGCRCSDGPSEDDLPVSKPSPATSSAVASTGTCPARPGWAGALADDIEVELLHGSKQGQKLHGTGYRLHADGTFETYDDIKVEPDESGKMVFKSVEGKWTIRGTILPDSLTALRKAVADQSADSLKGKWRTKGALSTKTHLTTRRDGKHIELCYVGTEAPKPVQPLEKQIHDLVNHVEPAKDN